MATSTDVGPDGRFTFRGLRDGYYVIALMGPEGSGTQQMQTLQVRGDPGFIRMEPARSTKDIGTIAVDY
jgi:hypothetical protein